MDHLILNNGSDGAALAEVALKALREARNSKTSSSGSIFVSDGQTDDDGIALGTGTIINGVDGGIQPWVGDTTAPGKPTGITAESHNGAIWVSWDGTLEGGVPADFDHVQFTAADGSKTVDMGRLGAAGKVTAAELTAGDTVTITAIAYDDAHDAQGNSTPNASMPSDPVTVVVQSAVDSAAVQKAQDDAQAALDKAGQAVDTADGKNKIFSSASEPSHTGIAPGDLWFQLDTNKNVSGIKVWNGSAFTDMVLLGNKLLVASSVGTTQIADNAIVTGKIAANAITAIKIAAQTITGDKLDVGSVASAIVTSGLFQTAISGARVVMDSNGISAYDSSNALTFQINAANGDVTSNGGTFTGSTFRTNAGSDRTEINNTGITVYKGGTAYAHMGGDTTYGLSLWDPISQTMNDASSMMFGTIYYQSEEYLSTKVLENQGMAPWFFDDANTAISTPTGRIMVSFSFSNDNTGDNGWASFVAGQIFVTSSPHGQHSQDDWDILTNGWVGETNQLRTGMSNFGLLPASRTEIISGLPKNVPLYPCLGIRGRADVKAGTRWSISVRLRTIVAHPC